MENAKIIRITVSEAARLFGVSAKSIRDAIKNQEINYIVVRNRYKINFESMIRWSQKNTRRKKKLSADGIGQFIDSWKMTSTKYSPRPPQIND